MAGIRRWGLSLSHPGRGRAVAGGLDAIALILVLLVVAMRPLISETYESDISPVAAAVGGAATVTSAATLWFDLAIWAAAFAALTANLLRGAGWRWTGAEWGWLLMVVGATLSTLNASNQRVAVNASIDWLSSLVLVFAVVNLCRERWRRHLLLAVIVAAGMTSAVKSGMQVGAEFAETKAEYQRTREAFWARQRVPLDDPRVELFERRMKSSHATGFFPHSNAEAGLLGLAAFAALGLAGVSRRRFSRVALRVAAAAIFAMIITTGSKGGFVAAASGGILFLIFSFVGHRLWGRWRTALISAWLAILIAAGGLIAYGRAYGGLPGSSLNFRWHYWQTTAQILQEYLWTGVGALNFDRAYLAIKPIALPEEIRDPHNFLLSVLAQWGLLGAVGLVLSLAGASYVLARDWARRSREGAVPMVEPGSRLAAWLVALALGFVILRLWIFRGYVLSEDSGEKAMVLFDLGSYGLLWLLSLIAIVWNAVPGRDNRTISLACLCGCFAFLVHNTIEFSILYPGTLTVFAGLAGVLLASQGAASAPAGRTRSAALLVAATAGLCIVIGIGVLPVSSAECGLQRARAALESSPAQADRFYAEAVAADPLDPTAPMERSALRAGPSQLQDLNLARSLVDEAIARDPRSLAPYHLQSRILEARWRRSGGMVDLMAAIGALRQAINLYPESPDEHVELADLLGRFAAETNAPELAMEAIAHYEEALRLNAARPGTDEVRRWPSARCARIESHIRALRKLATAPASGVSD